ncbi:enterotoxin [Bacillus cereus]|uniref:cell wall-binding protein EntA n=1 Tax=Bacillus paramycoides TaxID=2026194 RepID=UPI000BF81298|nr:cell wall-binding protein EntA [Bacillus paramycoides]PFM63889.1 enterotoxin [Bacillus cereus]MED0969779.1 cell wall-binding protein EntA [Bacillus paramycoides]MED0978315.1 cell wall-binding protein EntA [Bacillus paramycoides]MED0985250.1 cell wall-binding protein EntA [Bacillus paramycoides]MED1103986.1 cell wall-binding protein EntA [Bacillus paramycoides]
MKKLIGIATAAVFGLGIFTSSASAETVVKTDVLNVRENPTTESKVVGKLLNGHKLDVLNTENGWSQIKLDGKDAFVSTEFTKSSYYVTANVLNVRAEANTNSEILGTLKKDDMIETTNQVQNEWLQFEYNGKTAYVHVPFLTGTAPVIEKQETPAPAKAEAPAKAQAPAPVKTAAKPAVKAAETNEPSDGRDLTVVATAYTAHPSENGGTYGGRVLTAMGHDLTANPNMKMIAVDPKVIPLGSKVWVEGYGEAIAGDTGGAIKGNRIDVLVGSDAAANKWGRKSVKVKILK